MKIQQWFIGVVFGLSSLLAFSANAQSVKVSLTGAQEVPAVVSSSTGSGLISVMPDYSVSGNITTSGLDGTAAHIHEGALGKNGPVIITLSKSDNNLWSVPQGTKLTKAQFESFKNGNLYINVHTAANKNGEIRAQLQP